MTTVCQYTGLLRIFAKSGLGEAVRHQKQMHEMLGNDVSTNPFASADVVHLNSVLPDSWFVALWARMRGIPVVMHAHSTEEDFRNSFAGANLIAPLFRHWLTAMYSMGDLVLTPTAYSSALLERYDINRPIKVISNGVDCDFFRPDPAARDRFRARQGLRDDEKVIISVGHFFERKGFPEFVELARSMPEAMFFWFGWTDAKVLTQPVKDAIANRPDNLCLPGFVTQDELRDAYCGADLFCFMTHEETEGIVMLEALATGIPVLVRNIDIYRDWLPDGVITHQASDQTEFRTKARAIITGALPSCTAAGVTFAQRYDLGRVARQLAACYATVKQAARPVAALERGSCDR